MGRASRVGHPPLLSPHARPIAVHGKRVFVVNTPADTLDVIESETRKVVDRIDVGIDPVSIAVRPDGREVWVSNHVSDSVSVIDNDPQSVTYLTVIATIQDMDLAKKSTLFDEPVGIAFASDTKAYVALSSQNEIAVIDVPTRRVVRKLRVPAQDPRAIVVRNDRLYVIPFESNNKSQLSGGNKIDGNLVTFNAAENTIVSNNVLSLGIVQDIIKHPDLPDRDLFIYDTNTDQLVRSVESLGTLLYGVAVDSKGNVFIAQADARNDANGRAGTKKHGLKELENRAFLNQITKVDPSSKSQFFDLEPLPPSHPKPDQALATPFAIQVSEDDSTLFASAAGSDVVFTVDARSGEVLGRVKVDAVPRGIALVSNESGKTTQAWVLNAIANTVTLVDVSDPAKMKVNAKVVLEDPTSSTFKRGRIAFNTASASTTGTFSCASCHPDGHTDQLLWVLDTPIVTGGTQIQPRSTMPIRGLRDTAPFHWDGIPGDPYGGINSASLNTWVDPNSDIRKPESSTRHLADGALATTMMMVGSKVKNNERKKGLLSSRVRNDLAMFLLGVPYPPARERAYTNELSDAAREGFELFHIRGHDDPKTVGRPNICGDCHRLPYGTSTNTLGENGMDAPTFRGAMDRFLLTPQGRANILSLPGYKHAANAGLPEEPMWRGAWQNSQRFGPVWDMIVEQSTGFSGSFARQVTLSKDTVDAPLTVDLIAALEVSATESGVVLQVEGIFIDSKSPVVLQYDGRGKVGVYTSVPSPGRKTSASAAGRYSREDLLKKASEGKFIGTFTGRHGDKTDLSNPPPAIWTRGSLHEQRGQIFPRLSSRDRTLTIGGRHVQRGAVILIDGRKVAGTASQMKGDLVTIRLAKQPDKGRRFIQIQNPNGMFSNDFFFYVESREEAVTRYKGEQKGWLEHRLWAAIVNNEPEEVRALVEAGASLTAHLGDRGMPALNAAAFYGRTDVVKYLLIKGASVATPNSDGNTALHWAGFFGHTEICAMLLRKGARSDRKNNAGHSARDMAWGWTQETVDAFSKMRPFFLATDWDLNRIKRNRAQALRLLR